MDKPDLAGRRILVVEDEFILSLEICRQISDCGGVVVGPSSTLDGGYMLLKEKPLPDGGILNIRLGNDTSYPLADDLLAACVPIIFASSEDRATIPGRYANVPLVAKPINMVIVAEKLFPVPKNGSSAGNNCRRTAIGK
ncbi:response regulator [Paracoccus liaowanqingii]|uniref:Response regulator n=1 Tax=Paracoccus liaowanqingii TaxID=2560053 RepID=A0A4Z1CH44_9RHOB|nr:response regulator [Paracoccus liaowanqingii]TGN60127.1 response regulator [Paracoccus liaowanqingii]